MTTVKNWEEISREEVFKKYHRGIERKIFRLPNNKEVDFYLNSGRDYVACVAFTKEKKVILVRQFRPGPKKILMEIPGGILSRDETPEQAMERELLEETGYKGKIQFLTSIIPSAYATYKKNALIALDCEQISEPKLEDNDEELEVVLMSIEDFRKHIRTGQMSDVEISYLCLDHLGLL